MPLTCIFEDGQDGKFCYMYFITKEEKNGNILK
jgi:hypothetical protein